MSITRNQILIFFSAMVLYSIAIGINDSIFNNFLNDTFEISATDRGGLEFLREMPGLLVVLMAGLLYMLPITQLGVLGAMTFAIGLGGLGLMGSHWGWMITWMFVGSAGLHLMQPVTSSMAISLSNDSNRGRRLGQMSALNTLGMVIGTGLISLWMRQVGAQYSLAFICAACAAGVAGFLYLRVQNPQVHQPRSRLVIHRKFGLYYLLEFLFGARKQIFITFGFWVLVRIYQARPDQVATLLLIASILGIGTKLLMGHAVDYVGERVVLIADGLLLVIICLGYGFSHRLFGDTPMAFYFAAGCFVADSLLFTFGLARSAYMSRLADSPQEVTSTLAMGVSVNHIASMILPFFAGILWDRYGHEQVFVCAALLAVTIACTALFVPGRKLTVKSDTV